MREINKIIIHCSDSTWGSANEIDKWHKARKWDGIGYHFVIGNGRPFKPSEGLYYPFTDGSVEIGRSIEIPGAHVKGHNKDSIGICLIGKPEGFKSRCRFTIPQLQSLKIVCHDLMLKHNLYLTDIYGHYEYNKDKACPGTNMNLLRLYLSSKKGSTKELVNLLCSIYH